MSKRIFALATFQTWQKTYLETNIPKIVTIFTSLLIIFHNILVF
jgi:hypothetical protein